MDREGKSASGPTGGPPNGLVGGGQADRGWAGWLLARLRVSRRAQPRLALVERITLAPRQSLALVEAEGRRILVATSADGGSAFYALDEGMRPGAGPAARRARLPLCNAASTSASNPASRISW